MSDDLAEDIANRKAILKSNRTNLDSIFEQVQAYTSSYLLDILRNTNRGGRDDRFLNNKLYSGKAIHAADLFANGFIGNMCPRGTPWFGSKLHDEKLQARPGAREWSSQMDRYYYSRFDQSNFYDAIYVMARQAAIYCTAAAYPMPIRATKSIVFKNLPLNSYWIDEDEAGTVDTLYREIFIQNRELLKNYDIKKASIRRDLEANRFGYSAITHCTQPREDYDPEDAGNKNFPWLSAYVLDDYDSEVVSESGFESFPYMVWRFRKEPGTVYGFGPGIDALRDGQILQQVSKTMLVADQWAAQGLWQLPESMKDEDANAQLFPGGKNYVDSTRGEIKRVGGTGGELLGHQREERLVQAIHEHFFTDFFLMLQQAERQMTAQEVLERQAEKAAILTTIIGRFNTEVLDPVFSMVARIDSEFGLLPQLPESLKDVDLSRLDMDYVGPLAMVQKLYHRTMGTQRFLASVLPLAQAWPQILDRIDPDALVDDAADANNVEPKIVRTVDDANKIRQTRAQAQQEALASQAQQQALESAANLASKGSKPADPTSLVGRLLGGAQ